MKRVIGCDGAACNPREVIQSHLFVQNRENDNFGSVDGTSVPSPNIGIKLTKTIITSDFAPDILIYDIGISTSQVVPIVQEAKTHHKSNEACISPETPRAAALSVACSHFSEFSVTALTPSGINYH